MCACGIYLSVIRVKPFHLKEKRGLPSDSASFHIQTSTHSYITSRVLSNLNVDVKVS